MLTLGPTLTFRSMLCLKISISKPEPRAQKKSPSSNLSFKGLIASDAGPFASVVCVGGKDGRLWLYLHVVFPLNDSRQPRERHKSLQILEDFADRFLICTHLCNCLPKIQNIQNTEYSQPLETPPHLPCASPSQWLATHKRDHSSDFSRCRLASLF